MGTLRLTKKTDSKEGAESTQKPAGLISAPQSSHRTSHENAEMRVLLSPTSELVRALPEKRTMSLSLSFSLPFSLLLLLLFFSLSLCV